MEGKTDLFIVGLIFGAAVFLALIALDIVFSCKLSKKKKELLKAETNVSALYDEFIKARDRSYSIFAFYFFAGIVIFMWSEVKAGMSFSELFDAFWLSVLRALFCAGPRSALGRGFSELDKQQQKRIDALIAAEQKAKDDKGEEAEPAAS